MSNLHQNFVDEVARLARKEVKSVTTPLIEANKMLKKRIADLEKRVSNLEKILQIPQPGTKAELPQIKQDTAIRLSKDGIRKLRKKLGLSQQQFAILLGSNIQSVNHWETGKAHPRKQVKAKIATLRGLGKREIAKLLEAKNIKPKAVKAAKADKAVKAKKAAAPAAKKPAAAPQPAPVK